MLKITQFFLAIFVLAIAAQIPLPAFAVEPFLGGAIRTVALSDGPLPGLLEGGGSVVFSTPAIDGLGRAVFVAEKGRIEPQVGLYRGQDSALQLLLQSGEQIASNSGSITIFKPLPKIATADGPHLAVRYEVGGGTGAAVKTAAGFKVVGSGLFEEAGSPVDAQLQVNSGGAVAFRSLRSPFGEQAVFSAQPEGPLRHLRSGRILPHISLNDAGQVGYVLREVRTLFGVTFTVDSVRVADLVTGTRVVVSTENVADGRLINDLAGVQLNDAGEVAFLTTARGVTEALLVEEAGQTFRTAVAVGDAVRTGGFGPTFLELPGAGEYRFNDRGEVLLPARIEGQSVTQSNDAGLWLIDSAGGQQLIVREGSPVVGYQSNFPTVFRSTSEHQLNDRGDVAFLAELENIDESVESLWIKPAASELQLIVAAGQTLDVLVGGQPEQREVSTIQFSSIAGSASSQPQVLNDRGELAFGLTFTDGTSGVFVWSPVPEPGGMLLVIVASYAAFTCRPKRGVGTTSGERSGN